MIVASCFVLALMALSGVSSRQNVTLYSFYDAQSYGLAEAHETEELVEPEHRKHLPLLNNNAQIIELPASIPKPVPAPAPMIGGARGGDDSGFDEEIFVKRAVQFWVQKEYLKLYEKWGLTLTPNEITQAKATFEGFKLTEFQEGGKTGVLISLANDKLKEVVDLWVKQDLVDATDGKIIKNMIDAVQGQQDNKDVAHTRGNGDIIFARTAYINLQVKKSDPPTGTLIYMLRKFHFKLAMDVKVEKTKECYVWGLVCKTKVTVTSKEHDLSGKESTDLANYMKMKVANDYNENNGPYIEYLGRESKRHERFLPAKFRGDWDKINAQPEKDPTEIIEKNALDPSNYEL
uniref:Uncharacterized protein n=1 Tax=Romanomermis culicivorax TaxID=13658 RepID=A0A915JED2_ROMCU